jgi:transketolase
MGILGKTEELLKLEPLKEKFESFGFEACDVDGHSFEELRTVLSVKNDKPRVIIANTIKGKGVSYMEDVWQYHTMIPKEKELLNTAMEELN